MDDSALLRMVDANSNRAREALRVLEDYARFALDDPALQASLKALRHGFADAVRDLLPDAILHRDTPGDVGAGAKTDSEARRESLADVVVAAGKRLGEALRVVEEALKALAPAAALSIERQRYAFYTIEQQLARTLPRPARFGHVRLYVLLTQSACRLPWLQTAELALQGGADCLQLREKDLEAGEFLHRAQQLVGLCRDAGALCIINDRPDIAILAKADGVHVGQDDLPAAAVRALIGNRMLLGVSTHNMDQARQAVRNGADCIGVGPFFKSRTKPRDFIAGPEYAKEAAAHIGVPAIAIAGIDETNLDQVLATGVKCVAVSQAVCGSDDPRRAAERLKQRLLAHAPLEPQAPLPPRRPAPAAAL